MKRFSTACMYVCITLLPTAVDAQTATDFETRLREYSAIYVNENIARYSDEKHGCEHHEIISEDLFKEILLDEAKNRFIHDNMHEYLKLYFPPSAMISGVDTLICDNGGFEDDFTFYKGFISTYRKGSSSCTPKTQGGIPVIFAPSLLPNPNRFEIVTAGTDPLVGIQQVKFGEKALRINNMYGHQVDSCRGDWAVDRITKRFKVTEETREFTVWYAAVLENPDDHGDASAFISIKCDRAPEYDLCFDSDSLKCEKKYPQAPCYNSYKFHNVDVLDWTCHRIKIPATYIDSIATLEITVADCGHGGHIGYAYIDGICESCLGSALGGAELNSIDYLSCYEEGEPPWAKVCGRFSLPIELNNCLYTGEWELLKIEVPGYDINNLQVYSNNTFCFDFPMSNFFSGDCLEIYVEAWFTNGTDILPVQYSNSIKICKSLYEVVDCGGGGDITIDTCNVVVNIKVGACNSNGTGGYGDADQTPNISDDHYYVYVSLYDPEDGGWGIERNLVDPYPNENSSYDLAYGVGDTLSMKLGPFLIQEGDWWLKVKLPGCHFTEYIKAPDYCSGCEEFRDAWIGNVTCNPTNNTWSFSIRVPNENADTTLSYKLIINNSELDLLYNTLHLIDLLPMGIFCREYILKIPNTVTPCETEFTICPPKPCTDECKNLNVRILELECIFDPRYQQYTGYNIHIDIQGLEHNEIACYVARPVSDPGSIVGTGSLGSGYNVITDLLTEDIYLTVLVCPGSVGCQCASSCYKTIYIPRPDCLVQRGLRDRELKESAGSIGDTEAMDAQGTLMVIPNPFGSDEIMLHSTMKHTAYSIYDSSGRLLLQGEFEGAEQRVKLSIPKGTYFVRYINKLGKPVVLKMIKI